MQAGPVGLPDDFRENAQQCLRLAREATSVESRAHWLTMAQVWLKMAAHAEQVGMTGTPIAPDHDHDSNGKDAD